MFSQLRDAPSCSHITQKPPSSSVIEKRYTISRVYILRTTPLCPANRGTKADAIAFPLLQMLTLYSLPPDRAPERQTHKSRWQNPRRQSSLASTVAAHVQGHLLTPAYFEPQTSFPFPSHPSRPNQRTHSHSFGVFSLKILPTSSASSFFPT